MLTKQKISSICNRLFERVEPLLAHFGVEYVRFPNRLAFACPVHGGDNPEACCIFTDGTTTKGNWACFTHSCEERYINNMFGFVRGCLSYRDGREYTMMETAEFCSKFLKTNLDDIEDAPVRSFKSMDIFSRNIVRTDANISRNEIRSKIQIPSDYYIRRGYTKTVLDKFDVGECLTEGQPMSGRVVVPVYDEELNYVGCVGRSIKEHIKPKWLHSQGFRKNILYGLNVAKESITKSGTVILVEGQGDVWRLHEAGLEVAVGIFGASINDDQLILLEKSGAMNVVILTDSDEAGQRAYEQIVKKCGRRFNYVRPTISQKDVGDMTIQEIKEELYPQLKGIINGIDE